MPTSQLSLLRYWSQNESQEGGTLEHWGNLSPAVYRLAVLLWDADTSLVQLRPLDVVTCWYCFLYFPFLWMHSCEYLKRKFGEAKLRNHEPILSYSVVDLTWIVNHWHVDCDAYITDVRWNRITRIGVRVATWTPAKPTGLLRYLTSTWIGGGSPIIRIIYTSSDTMQWDNIEESQRKDTKGVMPCLIIMVNIDRRDIWFHHNRE